METEKIGNGTLEIPIEDNIRDEARLNEEGKIRNLGLSEASPTFIQVMTHLTGSSWPYSDSAAPQAVAVNFPKKPSSGLRLEALDP